MVDETDGAVEAGGGEGDGGGHLCDGLEGGGIDELEVVDAEVRGGFF